MFKNINFPAESNIDYSRMKMEELSKKGTPKMMYHVIKKSFIENGGKQYGGWETDIWNWVCQTGVHKWNEKAIVNESFIDSLI